MPDVDMLASARDRTYWMRGRWGLMVHWLYPQTASRSGDALTSFDDTVDSFDLDGFLADFAATGADWMIFTRYPADHLEFQCRFWRWQGR